MQILLPHFAQNQVLVMRRAHLARRDAVREIGELVHLHIGDVTGRLAVSLE